MTIAYIANYYGTTLIFQMILTTNLQLCKHT